MSRTFEGRDRFAPAAAWLAKGMQLSALGRTVTDYQRLEIPAVAASGERAAGVVLHVDRFGNLVTNIDRRTFETFAKHGPIRIVAGGHPVARLVSTYAEIGAGEVCALFGSSDHLELAANADSAAEHLRLGRTRWSRSRGARCRNAGSSEGRKADGTEVRTIGYSLGLPAFRPSGLPAFRPSGLPAFRLPAFRPSGLPAFRPSALLKCPVHLSLE